MKCKRKSSERTKAPSPKIWRGLDDRSSIDSIESLISFEYEMIDFNCMKDKVKDMYAFGPILGAGAQSTVFLGMDRRSGEQVAIKEVQNHRENEHSHPLAENFREIEVLKILGPHESIVTLKEVYVETGTLYIILDLCQCSLRKHIYHEGPFEGQSLIKATNQLFSALEFIHSKNVLHRDIKTDNV